MVAVCVDVGRRQSHLDSIELHKHCTVFFIRLQCVMKESSV
jgi:hypothetical protein